MGRGGAGLVSRGSGMSVREVWRAGLALQEVPSWGSEPACRCSLRVREDCGERMGVRKWLGRKRYGSLSVCWKPG